MFWSAPKCFSSTFVYRHGGLVWSYQLQTIDLLEFRLLRVESNVEPSLSFCMGSVKLNSSYSMNGEQQLVDGSPHAWPHRIHIGGRPSAKGIPADILFLPGMIGCAHTLEVITLLPIGQRNGWNLWWICCWVNSLLSGFEGSYHSDHAVWRNQVGNIAPEEPFLNELLFAFEWFQINSQRMDMINDAVQGKDVDECADGTSNCGGKMRCLNGGTCRDLGEPCDCPKGWAGRFCEIRACPANPCHGASTCLMSPNDQRICLCPYGKIGALCDNG